MADAVVLPVFDEETTIASVLDAVACEFEGLVIVVNDGSRDGTSPLLEGRPDVVVVTHPENLGYGRSLADGFAAARELGMDRVVTMDVDGQHEPKHIAQFLAALEEGWDIVSGSRYLPGSAVLGNTPGHRRAVNERVAAVVNAATGWHLTDAFCGFKAYRTAALDGMYFREPGYAMPMELWAYAHRKGLRVTELPVERIYFDHDRSFGEHLDDPDDRFAYYMRVWERALREERVTA